MITCTWCNKHYEYWQSQCDSCGGPMPPQPGHELPPEPPPVPRKLPAGYALRAKWWGNFIVMASLVFIFMFSLLTWAMVKQGHWVGVIFGLILVCALSFFRYGRGKAVRVLRAVRHGTAVVGEVASSGIDSSQSVNKRHPWKLVYHFTVDGHMYEGVVVSFEHTLSKRRPGQPLWIVYVPDDPNQNSLYPPVRYF